MSLVLREEGRGVTGKRARATTSDLPADASAPKKHSALAKKAGKRRPQAATSKDVSMIVHNPTFSLLDESKTFNKTQIRDKNVPRSGKFLLRTTKAPVVISQRRRVTEEEKCLALRKAMEFKSKHPFTMQIMIESYVYVGFFMNIACEFVRESLPRTSKKMTLWDPMGKPWDVSYVYYGDRAAGSFGGGWGRFALGNNLEKSDVCVFELFEEDNMRVHIYRVVPEITPLLRASNKD
nr:unknown [Zea mays]